MVSLSNHGRVASLRERTPISIFPLEREKRQKGIKMEKRPQILIPSPGSAGEG